MIKVLVSAIGGDIGQGVLRSLRLSRYKIRVIGCDIDCDAAGLYLCDKGYLIAPVKDGKKYINSLVNICRREKIDIAFICHELEQLAVSSNISFLNKKIKTYFVVQPYNTICTCFDKFKTYDFLSKQGIRVPDTFFRKTDVPRLIKKHGFPLIIKSRGGSGSRNFYIVKDQKSLAASWRSTPNPMAQEYIGNQKDEEYTVGLFLDSKSKVLGAIPMKRKLKFGLTWHAIVDKFNDVVRVAKNAAVAVGAVGPCNVQLRRDKNNALCVIEINARISSTVVFRAMLGFNEPAASIDYFLRKKIPDLKYKKGVVMRTWGELVIPVGKYKIFKKRGVVSNY